MRDTQYVEGLQMTFPNYASSKEFLKDLAVKFNSRCISKGKDKTLHETRADLFEFKTGLLIAWCSDAHCRGWGGVWNITVPYIIVDENRYEPGDETDLEAFIRSHWAGNATPVKIPKRRVSKSTQGMFPKLLNDLAATVEETVLTGIDIEPFMDLDVPDYKMPVLIKKAVAEQIKEPERYYEYLDKVYARCDSYSLHTMEYKEAVEWLSEYSPRGYALIQKHNYLLQEGE